MFNKLELEGLVLKGFFERNFEAAGKRQTVEDERHDFRVKIIHYNPGTGGFIAEGEDFFGESGLTGTISEEKIEFTKVYIGEKPASMLQNGFTRFHEVSFKGQIVRPDDVITCGGRYEAPSGWSSSYNGVWRLDSEPMNPAEPVLDVAKEIVEASTRLGQ